MHRVWAVLLMSGLISVVGGCDRGSGQSSEGNRQASATQGVGYQPSGVAVVDLDEVARRLGSDAAMVQALREGQASLGQQLQSLQASLQDQYRQRKREMDSALADGRQEPAAGAKQLEAIGQQLDLQLDQAWRDANNQIAAHRQRLVQGFRDEVRPVAQDVAAQRGLGVVVTKNENILLVFDQQHDITNAVVERMLALRAAAGVNSPPAVANRPAPTATPR